MRGHTNVSSVVLSLFIMSLTALACKTAAPQEGASLNAAPGDEDPAPADEAALTDQISQIFQGISTGAISGFPARQSAGDQRPARRDAHAKHHGCVAADFTVERNLPAEYRHGLFANNATPYKAFIRFSNGSFRLATDTNGDAHGMAIKVIGVQGEKLLDADDALGETETQDFVMIDHPVFFMRGPGTYIPFMQAQMQGPAAVGAWMQANQYEAGLIMATLAKRPNSPLNTSYFSQVPYKLGPKQAMKFAAMPCAGNDYVTIPEGERGESYLRETLDRHFRQNTGCFELHVQLQRDAQTMPVDDPTIQWPNELNGRSTWQKVATIQMPIQPAVASPAQMRFCEDMSFTPWHGLVAQRPLGGVNRVRRQVYIETSRHRHQANGNAPFVEPTKENWSQMVSGTLPSPQP